MLTFLLLYLYGMLGWVIYSDHDPERFGTIGDSLLTLFQVLTLEGWNDSSISLASTSAWAVGGRARPVVQKRVVGVLLVVAVLRQLHELRRAIDELETELVHRDGFSPPPAPPSRASAAGDLQSGGAPPSSNG